MSENTETKIIELFNSKIDELRIQFENENMKRKRMINGFLIGFGGLFLTFVFSAGVIVQKVNSLEKNYYKVADKVETLYMVAVKNGDIKFSTRGVDQNGN